MSDSGSSSEQAAPTTPWQRLSAHLRARLEVQEDHLPRENPLAEDVSSAPSPAALPDKVCWKRRQAARECRQAGGSGPSGQNANARLPPAGAALRLQNGLGFLQPGSAETGECCVLRPDGRKHKDVQVQEVAASWQRQPQGPIPRVSVQVVAGGSRAFLKHALRLLACQDAAPHYFEVIVVDDNPTCLLNAELLDGLGDPFLSCLRYLHLEERTSLGAKRNMAVALSRGDVVMHWDDHDFFGPTRVRLQSEHVLSGPVDVTLVPVTWTFDVRSAADGFQRAGHQQQAGGLQNMASLCYCKALWDETDPLRQYPEVSFLEGLFLFRNFTGILDASVKVLHPGEVEFLHIKCDRAAAALPRMACPAREAPAFLPQATLGLFSKLTAEELKDVPEHTILHQVEQERAFLDVYFKGPEKDLHIPRKYFMDLARAIPMISDAQDRNAELQLLAQQLLRGGLERLDGETLAMAAWCCNAARLPSWHGLWAELSRQAQATAPILGASEVSMIAYVAGRVGMPGAGLHQALFARAGQLCGSLSPQEIVNFLSAMARLESRNERVMINLMLRHPPGAYSSLEWLRLTWSVYRLKPEWSEQGYMPRFIRCPAGFTERLFTAIRVLAQGKQSFLCSHEPPILLVRNFLSEAECRELQDMASKQGWTRAEDSVRKASVAVLGRGCDTDREGLSATIRARAAGLLGLPEGHCESLHCEKYTAGEEHRAHVDFVQESDVRLAVQQADPLAETNRLVGGQRHTTVLTFLNDLEEGEGGETVFTQIGIRVRPVRGAALVWPNVGKNGMPDQRMMHASLPVDCSKKVVVSAWLRAEDVSHMHHVFGPLP